VKTAISIPDETFEQVERWAVDLGMSRSEFFTKAAQRYLEQVHEESLTAAIDAAIEISGEDDSSAAAVSAGRRLLAVDDDW
jgi:metal-responsive CopG/Arc/MetJ family transcriptional regulator